MKKRLKRNVKRTIRMILLAPGKLPRVRLHMLEQAVRVCEISGIIFVVSILTYLLQPDNINIALSIVSALIFMGFLFVIKLEQYQEVLDRQEYL